MTNTKWGSLDHCGWPDREGFRRGIGTCDIRWRSRGCLYRLRSDSVRRKGYFPVASPGTVHLRVAESLLRANMARAQIALGNPQNERGFRGPTESETAWRS